jgi:hypothetical protein
MRRTILAAAVAFICAPAVAQLKPVTIEDLRGFAAAGMAPTNSDIEVLRKCPGLRLPADLTPTDFARAKALGIPGGALWLRENDAAIADCLAHTGH